MDPQSQATDSQAIPVWIDGRGWSEQRTVPRRDIVVGRNDDCELVLDDPSVSRRHCKLTPTAAGFIVEDLGSRGGTRVGGVRITEPTAVDGGAVVVVGDTTLRLGLGPEPVTFGGDSVTEAFLRALEELAGLDELDAALRAVTLAGCRLAAGERAALFLGTMPGADLELVLGLDRAGADLPPDSILTRTLPAQAVRQGRTVAIADTRVAGAEEASPSVIQSGVESVICVPLPGAPGPLGVLYIDSQRPATAYTATERALLQALAVHASLTLERARFRSAEQRRTAEERRTLEETNASLRARLGIHTPVGTSPAMVETLRVLRRVAGAEVAVCLVGETGTGKEMLVRYLHHLSERGERSLVVLDCGAIPENLIESELFGHERGAFTGAHAARPGRFREADGGTIFLDEIGELPRALQSRLLRVLQERVVQPVGGKPVPIDVRVVAATHRDLEAMVAEGSFREDLFYRLATITLTVPALRDRGDDVLLLGEHFLARHGDGPGGARWSFSLDARSALLEHPWPGNVRELEHRIQRAVLLAPGAYISAFDLGLAESGPASAGQASHLDLPPLPEARAAASERFERGYLETVLRQADGSVTGAAKRAGVSRQALYKLMRRHGVARD